MGDPDGVFFGIEVTFLMMWLDLGGDYAVELVPGGPAAKLVTVYTVAGHDLAGGGYSGKHVLQDRVHAATVVVGELHETMVRSGTDLDGFPGTGCWHENPLLIRSTTILLLLYHGTIFAVIGIRLPFGLWDAIMTRDQIRVMWTKK